MNEYIIDAFTREGNNTNLEVNNLTVGCITSKNNNFDLDANGNLTINTLSVGSINKTPIVDIIYPVGSIYMSINATNPGTLFGGTWEQIKDKFLLACGDTYTNGSTGGEATHTLTINEMPNHNHGLGISTGGSIAGSGINYSYTPNKYRTYPDTIGEMILKTGGGQAHNNMPPYLTIYVWKRTN